MSNKCKVCGFSNCWAHNPENIVTFARGLIKGTGYEIVKIKKELTYPRPCQVCGKPAEFCCPFTFCDNCKDSPKAQEIRVWFREFIKKAREENKKI